MREEGARASPAVGSSSVKDAVETVAKARNGRMRAMIEVAPVVETIV